MTVTILEAKDRLSELVERAKAGERILVTLENEGSPVAEITSISPPENEGVRLGVLEHLGVRVDDSFWEPLPEEELRAWEGRNA